MTEPITTPPRQRSRRRPGKAAIARLGAAVLAICAVSTLVLTTSRAAFNDTTENGSSSFAAGDVVLTDDDKDAVMFKLADMKPGDSSTKCINVTYTGSLAADVKLYGAVGGAGLATYLDAQIDIGDNATGGPEGSCDGFRSSETPFRDTLETFGSKHTDFSNGLGGFDRATNSTTRSYQVTVTLQDNNAAQALGATATFTWEAQST